MICRKKKNKNMGLSSFECLVLSFFLKKLTIIRGEIKKRQCKDT